MIRICQTIHDIKPEQWNALTGTQGNPFMDYRFLSALETASCVGGQSGWAPLYIVAGADEIIGALPCFLKLHSYGEYIFDWAWADAAHRLGYEYYPKLVVASPFSPVGGPRLLTVANEEAQEDTRRMLIDALNGLGRKLNASSIHVLFSTEEEKQWLARNDYLVRDTFQFQWLNEGYSDFESFLSRFRSKRRNQIRRERRRAVADGITITHLQGDEITEADMRQMYRFYESTVNQFYAGQKYLNEDFFLTLHRTMRERICLVQAKRGEEVIAATFNLVAEGVFYGRYWGCSEEVKDLHFEVCCYYPIEIAIANGWRRVELGAGGRHKWGRGYLPQFTHSAHKLFIEHLVRPIENALTQESRQLRAEVDAIKTDVLKAKPSNTANVDG